MAIAGRTAWHRRTTKQSPELSVRWRLGAVEKPREGEHAQLCFLIHMIKVCAQVRQDRPRELIDQHLAPGVQYLPYLARDPFPRLKAHVIEGDTGNNVVGAIQLEPFQFLLHVFRRAVDQVQARIRTRPFQVAHETLIHFKGDEPGVRGHFGEDVRRDGPQAGAVFHNGPGAGPIDFVKQPANQET